MHTYCAEHDKGEPGTEAHIVLLTPQCRVNIVLHTPALVRTWPEEWAVWRCRTGSIWLPTSSAVSDLHSDTCTYLGER